MLGCGRSVIAAPCIAAAAIALATPARAVAATVTHEAGSSTVRFDAAPGEANAITIGASVSGLVVSDPGARALGGGGDCAVVAGSSTVSCPAASITTIEVRAGDGDDRVTNAGPLPVAMFGEDGSDVLGGGPAGETLDGGPGDDAISGGGGDDLLTGGTGADGLDGGEGLDTISYEATWPVAVDLPSGLAGNPTFGDGDRVEGVENVLDGSEEGTVTGTAAANVLAGGAGDDYVDGGPGADRLDGGDGPDVVAARDAVVDAAVTCGPGVDLAIVDPGDPVVTSGPDRCEQVDDGRLAPRRGRVSVRPMRCSAGDGGAQLTLPAMSRPVPLRYVLGLTTGTGGRPAPTLAPASCAVQVDAVPAGGAKAVSAELTGDAVTVRQTSTRQITTALTVRRPACAEGAAASAAGSKARRVRLRSKRGRGHWQVRGRFSTGAAEGTEWTTVESCTRTTTIVRSGRVRVFDRARHRSVLVRGGGSYTAMRR
jgi:hypothetical protein